jgi:transcriptional regulator with XRE-family HTH domain
MAEGALADLIRAYRTQALIDATGRSRSAIAAWRARRGLPDVGSLPGLAGLLNLDLADLTRIIAAEAEERRRGPKTAE